MKNTKIKELNQLDQTKVFKLLNGKKNENEKMVEPRNLDEIKGDAT